VFSLSTDAHNLYDHQYGILVPGIVYDDFMAENPDTEWAVWHRHANYNRHGREWERPVFVEAFTQGGERVIQQSAGLRVHGGATRYFPQKSLRLIARREYEPEAGRFRYPFWGDYLSAEHFERPILSYDTLILRNDGNDYLYGRIRTPLVSRIAQEAGFSTVSPQTAAAVFVNGEYYGFAWLNVQINEQFLEDLYGAPQRAFDIIDGGSSWVSTDDENIRAEFTQLLEWAKQGFTDNNIQHVKRFFDVDNLLLYYAIQTYVGNYDWPGGNIDIWRYTGTVDADNPIKELDGRWRFILYDIDLSLGIEWFSHAGIAQRSAHHSVSTIHNLTNGKTSPIFEALLKRPEYAEQFANYLCDMAAGHFSVQNVRRVIQDLSDASIQELGNSTIYGVKSGSTTVNLMLEIREVSALVGEHEKVVSYVEQRPDYIFDELREIFGYTGMYRIVSDGTGKINTLNVNEGCYFIENRVPITPVLARGQVFDYWLINGEKRYEKELLVSSQDADADGVVYVQFVSRQELPPLFFKETYDTGDLFGFTMYNPTDKVQNTQGLYLSNNANILKKWQFPNLNIQPGSTWEFIGRNSVSLDSLLKIGLNFNPRYGEVIFLSDENGVILDYIIM
jgi:hypothetical protein